MASSSLLQQSLSIAARWVFPVDGPPIEFGVVEFEAGRIVEVSQRRGTAGSATLDLGNVAIIPGLVNAHAHLEFASLSEMIQPPDPFTQWIRNLLAHRRERRPDTAGWIAAGSTESRDTGTVLVGDIATGDWSADCVPESGPQTIAFRELIGLLPEQAEAQCEIASRHIADCRAACHDDRRTGRRVSPGLSPHAPYSVSLDLFERLSDLAVRERVPLCVHLAETHAELQLLDSGTGEFVEMLSAFGLWRDGLIARGTRPLDFLHRLSEIEAGLIAHGNYFDDAEIHWLAAHPNVSTVYCPRTHHFFGHAPHPWLKLIEAGASVSLGTDGRSSNPDYSIWNELRFLDAQTHGKRRQLLLELGTLRGATALGRADDYGTLTVGKRADVAVVPLPQNDCTNPWSLLFAPGTQVAALETVLWNCPESGNRAGASDASGGKE